jgi:hypothetical protein
METVVRRLQLVTQKDPYINIIVIKLLDPIFIILPVIYYYYYYYYYYGVSQDSPVGIATAYGLDDRGVGVKVPVGSRIFTSPCRPDLLSNGYRGLFLQR